MDRVLQAAGIVSLPVVQQLETAKLSLGLASTGLGAVQHTHKHTQKSRVRCIIFRVRVCLWCQCCAGLAQASAGCDLVGRLLVKLSTPGQPSSRVAGWAERVVLLRRGDDTACCLVFSLPPWPRHCRQRRCLCLAILRVPAGVRRARLAGRELPWQTDSALSGRRRRRPRQVRPAAPPPPCCQPSFNPNLLLARRRNAGRQPRSAGL